MEPCLGREVVGPSGLQTRTGQVRTLGICLRAGRARRNGRMTLRKCKPRTRPKLALADFRQLRPGSPSYGETRPGGRARSTRGLAWRAAQLRTPGCGTVYGLNTSLKNKIERGSNF